jgi:hypothetical protein
MCDRSQNECSSRAGGDHPPSGRCRTGGSGERRRERSDRGISTTLGYTLTLGITGILVLGLLTAGSGFVEGQREAVATSELRVVGERLAGDIAAADRLVRATNGTGEPDVTVVARLPAAVAGTGYGIDVRAGGGNVTLDLTARRIDSTVTVPVANATAVAPGSLAGGDLAVVYNGSADRLEVTDAGA